MSYSLYIWHYLLLLALPWNGPIVTAPLFASSFLVAWASWRWVEQPARRRLAGRMKPVAAAGIPAAAQSFANSSA